MELRAKRIPFVTYPHEWCDAQLRDAGKLTLQLQQEAVEAGYDLKDASAWNIVFDGCEPVFCDLLSFERLESRRWWSFGQYVRHFVFPLLLSRRRGFHAHQGFRVWRDGVPPEQARAMLGWQILFTRYAPLFLGSGRGSVPSMGQESPEKIRKFRSGLHEAARWMLPEVGGSGTSVWASYEAERGHYSAASLSTKRETLSRWFEAIQPGWVADLGCNAGEFSLMAAKYVKHGVVAIDSDHDSIQRLYRGAETARVYPLVASLDDLHGGRGWAGDEFSGLAQRLHGRFDLVMMLALVHHLAVGASIPLEAIAALLRAQTTKWAIVEIIGEGDQQLAALCAQRQRQPSEFPEHRQRAAFAAAGFQVEGEIALPGTRRTLLLLRG
jgi:SAM-dependent methyltransferase